MASCMHNALFVLLLPLCVVAQGYYAPYHRGSSYYQPRPAARHVSMPPAHFRRSDTCSAESTCMFSLLCLMAGGSSGPSCPGGFLYTCCTMPNQNTQVRQPAVVRRPFYENRPSRPHIKPSRPLVKPSLGVQKAHTTRLDSTDLPVYSKPWKMPGNATYCGMVKAKPTSRIIGGNDAMYGEFPWQAHIKLNKQQCGGVLLNNQYVLTAAHCIYQVRMSDISIQLGIYDIQDPSRQEFPPQTFTVVEKKVHPEFKYQASNPDRYDVALLKLDRAARFHEHVVPICLPGKDWDFKGYKGIITGWGKTDAGLSNRYGTRLLQKVDVPIIANDLCEQWHHDKGIDITISEEMFCAGYEEGLKDACVGDSGGPLMVMVRGRWVVVGLVSAGFGCAQSRQPGIYHKVSSTVDWLRDNIVS